ncbi:MAG: ATP-dependent DNA helicase [Halioglobus sp.]
MPDFTVSVRDLVVFCHRRGDIDHRYSTSPTGAQGIEGHQRIYQRRPASYQSEYAVELSTEVAGLTLHVRGRADGFDASEQLVEEIKTCRVNPAVIPDTVVREHLAQGRLYAALIADALSLDALTVRLTWLQLDEDREYPLEQRYTADELRLFLDDTLTNYGSWLRGVTERQELRNTTVADATFPYGEFRSGQRGMAELVYKCVDQAGQLLLEAPTGMGKTAATLFPALKAQAQGKHDQVIFSTARTAGKRAAQDTLSHFRKQGMSVSALTVTAKDSICFSPGHACHPDDCRFAQSYYDKLPGAREEAVATQFLDRDAVELVARKHDLCPYQLTLDLVRWTDVVVADVHYVFSLSATLNDAADEYGLRTTVLLDEAHNLPSRARSMYRAGLAKAAFLQRRKGLPKALKRPFDRVNRSMLAMQKGDWDEPFLHVLEEVPAQAIDALQQFVAELGEHLALDPSLVGRFPQVLESLFEVLQFQRVLENWGADFRCELTRSKAAQSLSLSLICLDPARLLAEKSASLHALVAFSATLSPLQWMQACLGMEQEAVCLSLPSPFASSQLTVDIASSVDTRFRQREQSLPALVELLVQWFREEQGNCIVYFPSYAYLQAVLDALEAERALPDREIWVQRSAMDEEQRAGLLSLLERSQSVAAFCILGGVFGEGIDLPGELLRSVIVVGVGLPQFNRETEQLRDYFESRYGQGFDYAYRYPGLQKVNQALGRVIRHESDRGRALLIDTRLRQPDYRSMLAPWWQYQER